MGFSGVPPGYNSGVGVMGSGWGAGGRGRGEWGGEERGSGWRGGGPRLRNPFNANCSPRRILMPRKLLAKSAPHALRTAGSLAGPAARACGPLGPPSGGSLKGVPRRYIIHSPDPATANASSWRTRVSILRLRGALLQTTLAAGARRRARLAARNASKGHSVGRSTRGPT